MNSTLVRRHFLAAGLGGVIASRMGGLVASTERGNSAKRLDEIAGYFQAFAENRLLDADGLVRAYVSPLTLRPFTIAEVSPRYDKLLRDICQNFADPAGALTYENSLMATGEFAMSQILRFQKSRVPAALHFARRSVRAILNVAREGRHYMPGYLPKPHGGLAAARYSHEMSTDQYTKAIAALDLWRPFASPEEWREVERFFCDAAEFFIARGFRFPWRQKLIVEPQVHLHALALYLPLLQLVGTLVDPRYLQHLAQFERPLQTALERSRIAKVGHRFNEISLFLEGFDVAIRNGHQDPRLPQVMQHMFARGAENIDKNGIGSEGGQKTSWAVRLVAGTTLIRDAQELIQRKELAERVLLTYDHVNQMRVRAYSDSVDGIDGTGMASWLLTYWRLQQ